MPPSPETVETRRRPFLGAAPLLMALAALATLAAPAGSGAQPLTERTDNLEGAWITNPRNLHFQFSHRFQVFAGEDPDVGDIFTSGAVSNYPTFDVGYGLFDGVMAGVEYSSSSRVAAGVNEWQPYVKAAPVRGLGPARLSVAVTGAYNGGSKSLDGAVSAEVRPGPFFLMGEVRGFEDGFRGLRPDSAGDRAGLALGAGAGVRLNRYLTLTGDVSDLVAGPEGETAWSAGLHVGIPYTPHTLSLMATNVSSGTLEGVSVGDGEHVFWGFEFTVPFSGFARWGKIFGGDDGGRRGDGTGPRTAGADSAGTEARPVRRADRVVEIEVSEFAFDAPTVRVPPGTIVRWVNRDPVAHTATSDAGAWDSNLIGPGETWEREFSEPGRHPYHCTPHPFMTGTVVVAEPGS